MQDNQEPNQSEPREAASARAASTRAFFVAQTAASIDDLFNAQTARIEELEKQLSQAQAELVAKNAIIAEKDRFIIETVTRLNENVEQLLKASDLNSTQIIDVQSEKPEIEQCLSLLRKFMSPMRVEAIKILGEYLDNNPKNKIALEDWGNIEFANECIQKLVDDSVSTSCLSTSDCLNGMVKEFLALVEARGVKFSLEQLDKDFRTLFLMQLNDKNPDDVICVNDVLKLVGQLFGPKGYDIPSIAERYKEGKFESEHSSSQSFFRK